MSQPSLLIIDDEEDFHDLLKQVLAPDGYGLLHACDGESGLKLIKQKKPDLVILDVNMPVKDGYQVCREVRADPEFSELPILMLTIRRQDAEIIKGLDCGADDYLVKPFSPDELKKRIRNLLSRS